MEENLALKINGFFFILGKQISLTSKQIFSPSLSLSSHSIRTSHPLAALANNLIVLVFGTGLLMVSAENN